MLHEKYLISLMRLHNEYVVLYSLFILGIIIMSVGLDERFRLP